MLFPVENDAFLKEFMLRKILLNTFYKVPKRNCNCVNH